MSKYVCNDLSDNDWIEWAKDVRNWVKGKTGCQEANFFKDGIMNEKIFSDAEFRPLFILKEVHDEGPFFEDLQDIRETDIKNGVKMWRRLVTQAREMHKIYSGNECRNYTIIRITDGSGKEEYATYRDKIAVINLKKVSGGVNATSDHSKNTVGFSHHACKYEERLRTQISMINPSVIICCGTYDVLKDNVYGESFSDISSYIINGYHPNRTSNKQFYDEVLERYRAILSHK